MSDDNSSDSDSSSDDSGHSGLHASSGPIMGGKGPGQPDWMNKFKKPTKSTTAAVPPPPSNVEKPPSRGRPAPERSVLTPTSSFSRERPVLTPTSSFSRGEAEKSPLPEWMQRFQKMGQKSGGSDAREPSPPSPTRETIQRQIILPTAPTTPGWMKQYRKGPVVAGAPTVPMLPPMPPLLASAPAPSAPALAQGRSPADSSAQTQGKEKSSKKDWKALLNTSKAEKVKQPEPQPMAARENPTPIWMNKFTTVGKGLPMVPNMDGMDSDDDQSVTSIVSTTSVEPEWMSKFTGKPGNSSITRKKINPPPRSKQIDEPEWIQKCQGLRSSTNKIEETGGVQLDTIDALASPLGQGKSTLTNGVEPEWMTRYREIGVHDVQVSPGRTKPKFSAVPRMKPPSADLRKSIGPLPRSVPDMNNSFSNLPALKSGAVSSPMKPSMNASFSGGLAMSAMIHPPTGMESAPVSPVASRKDLVGGRKSAPSSPVTNARPVLSPAAFAMSPGRLPMLPQRAPPDPPTELPWKAKVFDPAARTPEAPDWMNKVKAVTQSQKQQPDWMLKLKRRNQGIEEPGPRLGTPPWKKKDRIKQEQTQKLREETGMLPRYDDIENEGNDSTAIDDFGGNESGLKRNGQNDTGSDDDSEGEDQNVPEWMRQFKRMHLKEAEVLSAQGRAPQGISRLRRGSMNMIERNHMFNPADEPVRAVSTVVPKITRKERYRERKRAEAAVAVERTTVEVPTSIAGNNDTEKDPEKSCSTQTSSKGPTWKGKHNDPAPTESNMELDSRDPLASSEHASTYKAQVEIDNTKPENVMSMWGKTVKAKKPGNATLMSFRMIQNQAETVKERIARAKQKAAERDDSDEDSIKDVVELVEDSGAVGSCDETKRQSISLDNSAAALFGFGGGTPTKRESLSMENSAAALFGFGGGKKSSENAASASLDNSAAALFGFGKANESPNGIDEKSTGDGSKSLNLENSAKSGFQRQSIAEGADNEDDDSSNESKQKVDEKPKTEKKSSFLDDSEKSDSSDDRKSKPIPATKKKTFSDDDDDDSSDDDKPKASTLVTPAAKKSSLDSDTSDDEKPTKTVDVHKPSPALAKKSSLDDSDSDDSSDGAKIKPQVVDKKKSFLDDDDSSSDDEKAKTSMPVPPSAKKLSLDSDSEDSSDDEKQTKSVKAPQPVPAPVKKSSLDDSGSDDSSGDEESKPKSKSPKPIANKKSVLDDSDDESDDDHAKPKPDKLSSDSTGFLGGKIKDTSPKTEKKSFLDNSESENSSDDEKPKLAPIKLATPAYKATPNSDSDDSSVDRKNAALPKEEIQRAPVVSALSTTSKKKSSLDSSNNEDSDSDDSSAARKKTPPKVEKSPSPPATAVPPALKHKSSRDSDSDSASDSSTNRRKEPLPKNHSPPQPADETTGIESGFGVENAPAVSDSTGISKPDEKVISSKDDEWGVSLKTEETSAKDEDAEWQAALEQLAAEEASKREKTEQDAWQAALEQLAAEETKKKSDEDLWGDALKDLAAEEEKISDSKKQDKEADKKTMTKGKNDANTKSKERDNATTGQKKIRETDLKKKGKNSDKDFDSRKGKDIKKGFDKIKDKKNDNHFKSLNSQKKQEPQKPASNASPFDSSHFGPSPFDASPFGDPSPFAPVGSNGNSGDRSPFDPIGSKRTSSDPSPFALVGSNGNSVDPSPFDPIISKGTSGNSSPFGPLGSKNGLNDLSPFDPVGPNNNLSPFALPSEKEKTKKSPKQKTPKSSMKLVVQTAKPKGNLHEKRTKKKGKVVTADDDDSFGAMDDFDDNFSVANDFGDFAEDRSVVPLRAVRNSSGKSAIAPKPSLHGSKKATSREIKDAKGNDKEKKSTSRRKLVSDRKSRSRSKSTERTKSKSRSKSADKKKSQSRSKSSGKKKDDSRGRHQ